MRLLDSGLLLGWTLQRLMGQVLKHKKAELKVTWIFEVSNTAIHWGILSEQVVETEKAVLAKHGVGSTSWFPLLSSKSPCAASTYPYYLQRSGWLGLFLLTNGHDGGRFRFCTAHETQVLWVSGWKLSSDSCLPVWNTNVSSVSSCDCAAAELSYGAVDTVRGAQISFPFALVLYDIRH